MAPPAASPRRAARPQADAAVPSPLRDAPTWLALAVSAALMGVGGVFILAPGLGAAIFGLPAPAGVAAAWVAVVGLRDLAFGGYVLALALTGSRRALGLVLAVTALIPFGDVLVLLAVQGLASPGRLLPHLGSAAVVAAAAAWRLRRP